jgi:hypothetical protein
MIYGNFLYYANSISNVTDYTFNKIILNFFFSGRASLQITFLAIF